LTAIIFPFMVKKFTYLPAPVALYCVK